MIPDDDVDAPTRAEQAEFFADRDDLNGPTWDDRRPADPISPRQTVQAIASGWSDRLSVAQARALGLTPQMIVAWGIPVEDVVAR